MNEFWRPNESRLLIDVNGRETPKGLVNPHCYMSMVGPLDIAEKMVWCATHDMSEISARNHEIAEKEHSWKVLKPRWQKLIASR